MKRRCSAVLLSILAIGSGLAATAEEVTIYRDTWGVPHVYGDSREAAAFGHGYAQAQDRLEDLLRAYLEAEGRSASVFGEDRVERDFVALVGRHAEIARTRYGELSAETRGIIEQFVAGVRTYMEQHPDEVPAWATPPEPHQVVALYRAFLWAWPWGQAKGDLKRAGSHIRDGRGSNQWIVGPSRTAEGGVIAFIDPHLPWEATTRFYEAHVHGGDVDFFGFSIIGTPLMAVGHTDVLSLACTTGGPDTADVYEVEIDPNDPLRYAYDGDRRPVRVEELEIAVRTPDGPRIEKRRIERTHHGPILKREGNYAYAVRTAYDDEIGIVEQWLEMIRARNLGEFLNAMRANQSLPQNIMYGDIYGHTYYVRAGRVPVRPEGFRWDRPVPGSTSTSEWSGIHDYADLVQIINPPAGFMQNCNVSPGTMMPQSPLTAERYPGYVYNASNDRSNSRGRRALQLLGRAEKLTLDDALRIAVDTWVEGADRWQSALSGAYETHRSAFDSLEPAVRLLENWNRRMDVDSRAAVLFRFWKRACRRKGSAVPVERIEAGEPLDDAARLALLETLDAVANEMLRTIGRIDPPWGELHRARRGDHSWGVGGTSGDGIKTLRTVKGSSPDETGISWVRGGQICTTIVLLKRDAVVSFSVTPYGQSDHRDSPHFADQGMKLFSKGKLKPTWYRKADLLRNLEARRVLAVPALALKRADAEPIYETAFTRGPLAPEKHDEDPAGRGDRAGRGRATAASRAGREAENDRTGR